MSMRSDNLEGREAALEAAQRLPRYFQAPLASSDGKIVEFVASIVFGIVLVVGFIFYCLALCRDLVEKQIDCD
jgi:hypothetical protein